ncbi:DNA polymerase-3 subunit gamma/tau [Caldanaerovirga acetigignens]|uniref:DNA-directed DNA polymerase n=2 Tax=Caldanaerovirga acetigignens TaxID=447595 RepID=A0A1M7L1J1_9FIRM|nr:DNA polymerase-3 subunit gamma/tau [Caldanaerovirga acetigignens]
MAYVALYRKYRPKDFDEIVGQEAIVKTLKNQLKSGKIGHAYLFCGMRGTGKTSTARVLAKALNCEQGPTDTPCNRCKNCTAINEGAMMDVIEMDAASNRGIDDIRVLRERVNFPPSEGRYRVYIIDEVHMLTTEAFNALLKTLEEPPRHVVFILATTEPNKLPATILSRCMRFDFKRVQGREMLPHLKRIAKENGIEADERALAFIARNSQGSMRDALSLLDKALSYGGNRLTFEDALSLFGAVGDDLLIDIAKAAKERNPGRILDVIEEVVESGKDLMRFVDDLMTLYRNMLMVEIGASRELVDLTDEDYDSLKALTKIYSIEEILNSLDLLKKAAGDVRWASQPRILLEAAMVKLAMPELWTGNTGEIARLAVLEERIEDLERRLKELIENPARLEQEKENEASETLNDDAEEECIIKGKDAKKAEEDAAGKNIEAAKISAKGEFSKSIPIEMGNSPGEKAAENPERQGQGDDMALEKLKAMWQDVLKELEKSGKMALVNVMRECRVEPIDMKNGMLVLSFGGYDGHKTLIEMQKKLIEEGIRSVTGLEAIIKGLKKNEEVAASKDEDVSDEEFIRSAVELFGEDLVELED